jgi:hypothetical protein
MKAILAGIFAGVVVCGASLVDGATQPRIANAVVAQSQPSSASTQSAAQSSTGQVNGPPRIAPGSVIPVQLTKSVDAKKVKTGDEVRAKVTQDMKAGNGETVVPKDTQIIGHITQAQVRSKEQKESQVGIIFEHAVLNPEGEMPLPMSIQAIIAPPTADTSNNNVAGETAAPPASASSAGGMSPGSGGRSAGAGAETSSPTPSPSASGDGGSTSSQAGGNTVNQQSITANTQGVVGISNLKLSTASSTSQASVLSSEKSNVKLESGTFMLLRVNP